MKNQTPHTPQNQTPSTSGRGLGGGIQMKPPIISPEIYERFEQLIAKPFSPEVIEACNKVQRELELKKQQNQQSEYIEINGIRLETENLGRPQNPKIKLNQQQAKKRCPQAWENNGNWYYNFSGAQAEIKYLGKKIPTQKQWEKITEKFGDDGYRFSKELHLSMNGYMEPLISRDYIKNVGGRYWSSTSMPSTNYGIALEFDEININPSICNDRTFGFSVRCIKKEIKKNHKKKKVFVAKRAILTWG